MAKKCQITGGFSFWWRFGIDAAKDQRNRVDTVRDYIKVRAPLPN
jgi:hypothetical protein